MSSDEWLVNILMSIIYSIFSIFAESGRFFVQFVHFADENKPF